MTTTLGVFEAKANFSDILDSVERGEHVTISDHGAGVAELEAIGDAFDDQERQRRQELIADFRAFKREHGSALGGLSVRALVEEGRRF